MRKIDPLTMKRVLREVMARDGEEQTFISISSPPTVGLAWTSTLFPWLLPPMPTPQQVHTLQCASAMTWLNYHTTLLW